jgi:uncharacterized membrane protein
MTSDSTTAALGQRVGAAARIAAWVTLHRHTLVVWTAIVVWTTAAFAKVRSEYEQYQLGRFDLGDMVQAVWSTLEGRPLENTLASGEQASRLAGHVDPILVLLTPLWLVVPSPLMLAAAQIAALGLGALPVFWLGRRHLGSNTAAMLMSIAYLAYPWLAWTALDAMHPVTFAIPLLLYCVWFLDSDRLAAFVACGALALACGELIGLAVAALGVWYALARGRRRAGFAICAAGAVYTFVALFLVVPAVADGGSPYFGFYERVGGSAAGVLQTAVTDPTVILSELFAGNVFLFALALAAPLAGLFILSPLAAAALPTLAVYALADGTGPLDPRQHYLAAIVPFLVAGTVLGISRLRPKDHAPVAAMVVVVSSGLWAIFGPWDGAPAASSFWYQSDVSARHVAALDRAVALVPDDVPISTSNRVGGHFAARRYLYMFPILGNAEWIVLDTHDLWLPDERLPVLTERPPAHVAMLATRMQTDPRWKLVLEEDGVYVFRKRSA